MDEVKYFLVLEKRPGDYNLIDITKLDICDTIITTDLGTIDAFTSKYEETEIKASIERSNMAQSEYLSGSLKIISDMHHHLNILTKETFSNIMEFQNSDLEIDKDFKNKLYGYYKKIIETLKDNNFVAYSLDGFKEALRSNNKPEIFRLISELPYAKSRSMYFMIGEEYAKKREENLRKLEKLNDNE